MKRSTTFLPNIVSDLPENNREQGKGESLAYVGFTKFQISNG